MDAVGQVSVTINHEGRTIKARAASTDVVVASVKAYLNAINKMLAARESRQSVAAPKTSL
jgi:2-isopropylmalate synthase